ncbi:MAG: DegT/DnrJ/EryC1/StrS family aminotransferase [Nitriliruptoraceae bacterium]|nr:DegT/DnrJ/EryC1/StrS family aminotransferase [Nitriliruptoraceae bacterium]
MRIFLSPPDVGPRERELLLDAFDSNWIAPLGPHVDAFEAEVAARAGRAHGVALSSGTAALHLALRLHGVGAGDRVLCSTLTFIASANAILYLGAEPVFVDVAESHWNLDPDLVAVEIDRAEAAGERIAAVLGVGLYGSLAGIAALERVCRDRGVPFIEDAAEALGSTIDGRPAGNFGDAAIFSFNGNKIITTSGGGMLVTDDGELAARARSLASQAREPAPHYEHVEVGYNYRLSNLLAALGRAQLEGLDAKVDRRRELFDRYVDALADLPGFVFAPELAGERGNRWLTCLTVDPDRAGADREAIRLALRAQGIEARPVWKPMHQQPVFADREVLGGARAAQCFADGLCLPSGSSLTDGQQDEVIALVRDAAAG